MSSGSRPHGLLLREAGVEYLRWAMRASGSSSRISLLSSGTFASLAGLGTELPPYLDPSAPFSDRLLRERLAARYGVPPEETLTVLGTSLGLFLAMAAILEPGDEVLVEHPGYEPLVRVPQALGARVRSFPRRPEADYRLEPDRVEAAWTDATRLVVVSDLHNPTAAGGGDPELAGIAVRAAGDGAYLLVDEVYRDFRSGEPGTARKLGGNVVAVGSLTKVYGLGELRAGWVFAPAPLVERMESILTVLHVVPPAPMLAWFQRGLDEADRLRDTAQALARRGWDIVREWAGKAPDGLRVVPPAGGVFVWMALPGSWTGTDVAERLLEAEGVAVVPGRFFGDDHGIRVGIGGDPDSLREGLAALDRVLRSRRSPPASP